jgi:2'-5' RNA ligase
MQTELIRAFLALEVPAAVKMQLAAAQESLRRELPRARWTRPDGWHLTLKFLGEVAAPALDELAAALAPSLRGLGEVSVRLGGTGFFPSKERPRVAWVGGAADGAESVVAEVERAADAAGFPRERRPWSIHLTQARLKARWPSTAVDRFLEWGEALELEAFDCREVVLYKSDLQPGGAVYTALERLPLARSSHRVS